ncbi:hypothetical protein [Paenibacillus sp. YSY-4.3]
MSFLIQANGLAKAYKKRGVVKDISLTIYPGEVVGIKASRCCSLAKPSTACSMPRNGLSVESRLRSSRFVTGLQHVHTSPGHLHRHQPRSCCSDLPLGQRSADTPRPGCKILRQQSILAAAGRH